MQLALDQPNRQTNNIGISVFINMKMIRHCIVILWVLSISGLRIPSFHRRKYTSTSSDIKQFSVLGISRLQPIYANKKHPSEDSYVSHEINFGEYDDDDDGDYDDDDMDDNGLPGMKDPRQSATRNE